MKSWKKSTWMGKATIQQNILIGAIRTLRDPSVVVRGQRLLHQDRRRCLIFVHSDERQEPCGTMSRAFWIQGSTRFKYQSRRSSAAYLEENHEETQSSGNAVCNRRHGNGCWRPDHRQLAQRHQRVGVEERHERTVLA